MRKYFCGGIILLLLFSVMVSDANALNWRTHQLTCITNNNAVNAHAGERQLSFDISSGTEWADSASAVSFKFYNRGTAPMTVTRIVFDFPNGVNWIGGGMGDFQNGVLAFDFVNSPQTALPGWNNIVPSFHNDFELSASYGLKPGQMFNAHFYLNMPVYNIENAINTGAFKVGFYANSFANGGNESFASVPEPLTALLLGLGGIFLRNRK